ncbi:hypothetical protein [Isoptericola sp. NPDC057191]|uniref:hypothetical protein n=1 Tax=Isoptericola sp. NPDC057191 TaxID=3346041 RepID=UPI00362B41A9
MYGKGRPARVEVVAGAMHNGDLTAAAAHLRSRMPYLMIMSVWSIVLVLIGVLGAKFLEFQLVICGSALFATLVLWVWAWFEREFARPGWFVPVELRGTPGLRMARKGKGQA